MYHDIRFLSARLAKACEAGRQVGKLRFHTYRPAGSNKVGMAALDEIPPLFRHSSEFGRDDILKALE